MSNIQKIIFLILIFNYTSKAINAQTTFSKPLNLNSFNPETGFQVERVSDGYFILVVLACDSIIIEEYCTQLVKLDLNFQVEWSNIYNTPYGRDWTANPNQMVINEQNNKIYIIGDYIYDLNDSVSFSQTMLMGLTLDGDTIFTKKYETNENVISRKLIQTNENTLIYLSNRQIPNDELHYTTDLIALDTLGESIWESNLGISNQFQYARVLYESEANNEIVVSSYFSEWGSNLWQTEIMRFSNEGVFQSSIVLPYQEQRLADNYLIPKDNEQDGYILGWIDQINPIWDTFPYPPVVYGLTPEGETEWSHTFIDFDELTIHNMHKLSNGDVLLVGMAYNIDGDHRGGWLVRITQEGELLWVRQILDNTRPFTAGRVWDFTETPSGGIFAVGFILDTLPNVSPSEPESDTWLLLLDEDGCLEPDCGLIQLTSTTVQPINEAPLELDIFPNPASRTVYIRFSETIIPKYNWSVQLVNLSGQLIREVQLDYQQERHGISVSNLPEGMYYLVFYSDRQIIGSEKIVVLH